MMPHGTVYGVSASAGPESAKPPRAERPSLHPAGALSVDVEDYFHVEAFADRIRYEDWPSFPSRVVRNTQRLLELFARHGARGTFFILGWVAEREPALVRQIAAAGHEIACHSYRHAALWRLTPEEFRADTRRAVQSLEEAAGVRVVGYRAPTFSIVPRTLWALEILAEEGFLYDSSVFPVVHDLYGIPEAPRFPFRWELAAGRSLYEIPPMTVRLAGRNLAIAGGGYLRLYPMWLTRWAVRRVQHRERRPVLIYLHPWEIDPAQPRLAGRWKSRLRHYRNLEQMEARLDELLRSGPFVPFRELLAWERQYGHLASVSPLRFGRFPPGN
jgi:polysaccharide deacetylase family protein (PEP-CTERM system associated)